MAYVKPGTKVSSVGPAASSDSDYLAVDGKGIPFNTAVEATIGGFGVVDPNTGDFEVLDALPLGRQAAQLAVEAGSNVDFATVDYVTGTEVDSSAVLDSEIITSDLT